MKAMFDGDNPIVAAHRLAELYPAVWLQLQVRRSRYLPTFTAAIPAVIEHARSFPGMVRFGFDIDLARARFRTFGAFNTEQSLQAYVIDGAHGAVYRRLRGRLGDVIATYGMISVAQLPKSWDDIPEKCFTATQTAQGQAI